MALIICPECEREISETAHSCPNCGYQLTPEIIAEIKEDSLERQKKRPFQISFFSTTNGVFGGLFLLGGLGCITESLLGGLCLIIISLLLLPPVRNYVYSKTNKKITLWQRAGLIFILFIIFSAFIEQSESSYDGEKSVTETSRDNSSSGGEHQILKDNIGCTDKEYFYKMVGYAVEKDYEAFDQAFAIGKIAGICTTFKKGETVYLTDVAMFKGLIKLRRRGEVEEYWTNTHVID